MRPWALTPASRGDDGVAGKIYEPADALQALALGADFAILGRVAIVHHDYPSRLAADPTFAPLPMPVAAAP